MLILFCIVQRRFELLGKINIFDFESLTQKTSVFEVEGIDVQLQAILQVVDVVSAGHH